MEKIWLKSYQAGVATEINPDSYTSLVDVFLQSCQKYQAKPALSNLGHQLTFNEWYAKSTDFAAYLQQGLGLKKGDRIAIMMPNMLQYPVAMFGAFLAGLVVVNFNPLYTASEVAHQLKDSGTKAIIVLSNFAHILEKALPEASVEHVIVTSIGDMLPFPKSVIVNWVIKYVKRMEPSWNIAKAIPFTEAMKRGKQLTLQPISLVNEDIAFLQYTGGTTGVAKGAVLTHRNMVANLLQAEAWIRPVLPEGEGVIVTALPLYHIFSLTANCLTFLKQGWLNVLITNPRDIAGFIAELRKIPFAALTGVNTLFNALLNNPAFAKLDFSHLRLVLGGGMAVQHAVAERWQAVTGKPLVEAYGLTETSPAVTINPFTLTAYNGSIGLPISSTDIAILDEEGHELPLGEAGELCIKGPQVMRGYWNNPDETNKVFTKDGWLRTGDIATVDPEGFVRIVDRKKDMIIVSGFNVYPNQIEDVIAEHPGVLEVAVVGVADPVAGEVVKAVVVRKDPNLTAEDIIAYCRLQLTGYKIPKLIEFRDELPKTNVGKILRRALR